MGKIHTRTRRKLGLPAGRETKHLDKAFGEKTFKTEEAAKKWAADNDVDIARLEPAKKGKKFKIIKA